MTDEHEKWLNLTAEDAIEPELPICDSHHHLWIHPDERYLLDELMHDIKGHNIVKSVFLDCRSFYRPGGPEAMRPVGETEFVQSVAEESTRLGKPGIVAGIVSWADLTLGEAVAPVLEAHIEAGKGRFKGIRQMLAWVDEPGPGYRAPKKEMAADPKLRQGLVCLKTYNLVFETGLFNHQLMELVDLARAFPDLPMILDHLAAPRFTAATIEKSNEVFLQWKKDMATLASCQNVQVKLGGFGMGILGHEWINRPRPAGSQELADAAAPWVLWCIEKFGVNRCMFESNFPVDRRAFSYNVIWNAFKRITRDFSQNERKALFNDTATRIYRL